MCGGSRSKTVDNTPDTRLLQIDQTADGNVAYSLNIENVDWEVNVDDIMTVIKKKCNRAYPHDYFLLVHARNYRKVINFELLIEEMKSVRSPFLEIWVIAFVGLDDIKVVRVSPALTAVDLNRCGVEEGEQTGSIPKARHPRTGTRILQCWDGISASAQMRIIRCSSNSVAGYGHSSRDFCSP